MNFATIDWDHADLLPKFRCCVCENVAVPWGRAQDEQWFCSKRCCDAHSHRVVATAPNRNSAPATISAASRYLPAYLRARSIVRKPMRAFSRGGLAAERRGDATRGGDRVRHRTNAMPAM